MGLDASKMAEVEANLTKRKELLIQVTSKPFNINNQSHNAFLKNYVNDFEYNCNLMYLYHAFSFSKGLKAWGAGSLVWAALKMTVGIPDVVDSFIKMVVYANVAGYILEKFSMTDFNLQLNEMKMVYQWVLKNGTSTYNSSMNNSAKLANPEIRKMITLLAPFCDTDFMIVWPKVTQDEAQQSSWANAFASGSQALYSTLSLFGVGKKENRNDNLIQELKINVETKALNLGLMGGLQQAFNYFIKSQEFWTKVADKVQNPFGDVKTTAIINLAEAVLRH